MGWVLLTLGIFFRVWAIASNKYFVTEIVQPAELITTGPYAFVRHPGYLGSLLIIIGLGLLLVGWQSTILFALLGHEFLTHRADLEEQLLTQKFPEYAVYKQNVGQILPNVRRMYGSRRLWWNRTGGNRSGICTGR